MAVNGLQKYVLLMKLWVTLQTAINAKNVQVEQCQIVQRPHVKCHQQAVALTLSFLINPKTNVLIAYNTQFLTPWVLDVRRLHRVPLKGNIMVPKVNAINAKHVRQIL